MQGEYAVKEVSGNLDAKGLRVALVASRFNSFLVEQLVKGAVDAFVRHGGDEGDLTLVRVPGAYELPIAAKKVAATGGCDAIVALGAVVQGATPHASLINETTARAFTEIALETGVPVADGVVSAENLEQAIERCGTKQGNKGFSAMQAAIEIVNVMKGLK
ncbi:MAG: 6,7-dimethyl-8-ribityllumazine synthase [Kiritimatiellia bacterium]|nr:6,7-dimethyl-8-ribityllumazine synthase [Kiritimatiellia bacterium]